MRPPSLRPTRCLFPETRRKSETKAYLGSCHLLATSDFVYCLHFNPFNGLLKKRSGSENQAKKVENENEKQESGKLLPKGQPGKTMFKLLLNWDYTTIFLEVTFILLSASDLHCPIMNDGKTVNWKTGRSKSLKCYVSINACNEFLVLNLNIRRKECKSTENQFLSSPTKVNDEQIYFKHWYKQMLN